MTRCAKIKRVTKETEIELSLNLDGKGKASINTGVGFFDHMLNGFTCHGLFDIELQCKGDLNVDTHHSIEDIGIVLGNALKEALGDKVAIKRYGSAIIPMDDALILCAVDLSGRPYFSWDVDFSMPQIGSMDAEVLRDFFYSISYSAGMNLHMKMLNGFNNHHIAECCFKAFAKALDMATMLEPRISEAWSTKGTL